MVMRQAADLKPGWDLARLILCPSELLPVLLLDGVFDAGDCRMKSSDWDGLCPRRDDRGDTGLNIRTNDRRRAQRS